MTGLKKELSRLEKRIKALNKQKSTEISDLAFKLQADIKAARQPLNDLEVARDAKMQIFKQETESLLKQEKPVAEGIYAAIKQRESIKAKFEALGIRDPQFKNPALFYVPFYAVCYQVGLSRRYIFVPPSTASNIGFSAKLKGFFGISRIKAAFAPRFQAITALIATCQILVKRDTSFESELEELGEKNNLLNNRVAIDSIAKGLVYLQHEGLLSDREYQSLSKSIKTPS